MCDTKFRYEELRGEENRPYLDELGKLRIAVFREFPYLYDGELKHERKYVEVFAKTRSLVVLLRADERIVGASTCLPIADAKDAFHPFQIPFIKAGFDLGEILYFGESVILPEFRGMGAGHEFFRRREAYADQLGLRFRCFCAVDRPEDHPERPEGYRDSGEFWSRMGFQKREDLRCQFGWKEPSEKVSTRKSLTFWLRDSEAF